MYMEIDQAQARLRNAFTSHVQAFTSEHSGRPIAQILDVGCSVGISTDYLIDAFPRAEVSGIDLSPHFLAVARHRDRLKGGRVKRWYHRNAEQSGLPDASFDFVSIQVSRGKRM
jgi:ubiquinone/menaquinone biosynthesis C-methylase UbiE